MTCANFKPLEHSMEELVEYLKRAKFLETENPPKRNNQNNNLSGLKKTKKSKYKHGKDKNPKTSLKTLQAITRAASCTSSARCLVAMLNCIPLIIATTKI
eukprot:8445196-Ditylum_brightwellii.AAC.1